MNAPDMALQGRDTTITFPRGGRPVLACTSLIFVIGLAALGMAQGVVGMFVAWLIIGVGIGSGLYEAAFATSTTLTCSTR